MVTKYADPVKQQAMEDLVRELEQKRCIAQMRDDEKGYFSQIFVVPKRAGVWRLIIDLSQLNQSLQEISFTMDDLRLVKQSLQKGMWATSMDLSDAYHHIPIRSSSQVYL